MKKICVITGTRAEYGLLKGLMVKIQQHKNLELKTIVTGMHLSAQYGSTWKQIEEDGIRIDYKVDMLLSGDSINSICKSLGLCVMGMSDVFTKMQPDLIIILGDRYEAVASAIASQLHQIPIAHIHGGELTEGAVDDAFRHSITKLSVLHFVTAQTYKQRVIQLGEQENRVFNVGALGIDNIKEIPLLPKDEFEQSINFKLKEKNILITFHPVTLEDSTSGEQMEQLLEALTKFPEVGKIFTMPNSDPDNQIIFDKINNFVKNKENAMAYDNLGTLRYLSAISHVDCVLGNSSSGIIEVPSLGKPTINIGDRQRGRIQAESIINCEPKQNDIEIALKTIFELNISSKTIENPYGEGGTADKIIKILDSYDFTDCIKKKFKDITFNLG
jgi:GDP/UDP-N,N'-diacetylbacillosamine 2-epimerase (hydrolysing)